MATTKIWDIKGRLDCLINYAANPEKTDENQYNKAEMQVLHNVMAYAADEYKTEKRLYVSGVNVTPDTYKMQQTKLRYGKTDGIIAFHAIQSFKPGEVTPELAHKIGVEFAKEMWGDRFEVLIATHLNRQHLHNHFVINSVSFADGKKYYDNTENYNLMKKISDRLCEENNLSVIRNPKSKGRHYAEVMAEKNGYPTIRGQIKDELDEIIKCSYTYEQFWKILKQRGYEVKRDVRYIALKPAYSQRYIRLKSLGKNYSEEAIRQRIISARNGIRILDKPATDYNAWLKKYEPIKLHGFKALYYHYLYLFGKIRKKETPQGAPAIKQAAHGRCLGRRHGRLILPCRFSVFTCFVCAFAFFAQLAIVTIFLLTPTRISECRRFYVFAVFVTRLPGCSHWQCLPRKLLFCFCRFSGVPETVVPFPPGWRGR